MILVVTPLPIEAAALRAAGLPRPGWRVEVGGHGKVQYALRVQNFLSELRGQVRLVVCAGACGSLLPTLAVRDVVVAEHTLEHDFRLRFLQRPLPKFSGDRLALESLRQFKTSDFGVHFGPMASGDEDIVDADRAREIHAATSALAVAWEGAGGARASLLQGVPYIEVRGVTDSCDGPVLEHFQHNLSPAMAHVAQVLAILNPD